MKPYLLLGLFELDLVNTSALGGETLGLALAHGLVLDTTGLHLFLEVLGAQLFGLGLVDVFHQDTLVLEAVTLGFEVQGVVAVESVLLRCCLISRAV